MVNFRDKQKNNKIKTKLETEHKKTKEHMIMNVAGKYDSVWLHSTSYRYKNLDQNQLQSTDAE